MRLSIAFHIIGLVMWLGGLMVLTRCLKVFCVQLPAEAQAGVESFRSIVKRLLFGFVFPGALISLVSGLYQLLTNGAEVYMKQGWFHGKLFMVLVLFVVTFFVTKDVQRACRGELLPKKRLLLLHILSSLSLIVIVFLTILGR